MEVTGLIPAGGLASRLGKLPFSKEVFPLAWKTGKPIVLSENLIDYYKLAGIRNLFFIIRSGKWDIPAYFADGSGFGVHIGYLMMNLPYGTPFTINQAFPFIHDKMVALGFPDIIFEPRDAFLHLKTKFLESNADIILGVVPSVNYLRSDMIEFDEKGRIRNLVIKENRPDLLYSWFIALWRPSFTLFIKEYLEAWLVNNPSGKLRLGDGTERELYMGDVISKSISSGLQLDHLIFEKGFYRDMGTWEEWQNFAGEG